MSLSGSSIEKDTRLWAIAKRVLAPERTYTQAHIQTKLETYLKVSPERAENGFSLMVKYGILTPTYGESVRYYLSDTTPF